MVESLEKDLLFENLDALKLGVKNLEKHVENVNKFNLPVVIALNEFITDTKAEKEYLLELG